MIRQRGNAILYGVIALFIITIASGIVYTYTHAIERAQKAETDNTTLREKNSEFASENANLRLLKQKQDLILAERQGRRNAAADWERIADEKLRKAMQQPEVRAWSDTPVPQPVIDSVRNGASADRAKNGGVPTGSKPAAAKPGR